MLGISSSQGLEVWLRIGLGLFTTMLQPKALILGSKDRDMISCPIATKTEPGSIDLASAGVPLRPHAVHTTLQSNLTVTGMDTAHRGIPLWQSRTDPGW